MTNATTEQVIDNLTAVDRRNHCGAQAYLHAELSSGGELLFYAHHADKHYEKFTQVAAQTHGEAARLEG